MASSKAEGREANIASCLAALGFLIGLVLCAVSFAALKSGALYVVDRLVVFDTAWHARTEDPPVVVTTRRIYEVLIFVGLLVAFASLVGIIGAKANNKLLVSAYVGLAGVFTAVTLAAGVQTMQRRAIIEPMISRQVEDICNSTTYIRLATNIPCKFAQAYAPSEVTPCGVYCEYRSSLLRQLRGCQVMLHLCQQFFYEELPGAGCASEIAQEGSMMYLAVESNDRCRQLCDEDVRCTAYAYSGASEAKPERCLLGQGVASAHPPPRWSLIPPAEAGEYLAGGSSISCYRRKDPVVLAKFREHGARLATATLALGVILFASTAFNCCLMYNMNFKRRDLPRAAELALMMCCPCCAGGLHRRFNEPGGGLSDDELSDDDGDEVDSEASAVQS